MTTMKDIARQAGVSVATVSHVVNSTRFVRPEIAERVLRVIQELHYEPDGVARSLRAKETRTLGMIVPDNANPFFAQVAREIENTCFSLGYTVILCNTDQNPAREKTYIDLLVRKRVDGIIFVAAGGHAGHLSAVLSHGTPVVVVDRELEDVHCDTVVTDNRSGGHMAVSHLIDRGHRRIACIAGPSNLTPSWQRVLGYREALEQADLIYDEGLVRHGDFQSIGGYAAMRELLQITPRPNAVLACNDLMAIGALRAITECGLRVPEDMAVVGFDDIPLASYTNPPLTTVGQPLQMIGRAAADLLIQRIGDPKRPFESCRLQTVLVVRLSS